MKFQPVGYLAGLGGAIALTLGTIPAATAASFTGEYAVGNFTFSSSQSNTAGLESRDLDTTTPGSVILYSPDTGANPPTDGNGLGDLTGTGAFIDWTIAITPARAGTISFNWLYNSLDSAVDDSAGYLLNGVYNVLATTDNQSSGSPVTLSVNDGDIFGFRAASTSNTGGSGYMTVSDFQATPVPFEFSPTWGLGILGVHQIYRQWRKRKRDLVLSTAPTLETPPPQP